MWSSSAVARTAELTDRLVVRKERKSVIEPDLVLVLTLFGDFGPVEAHRICEMVQVVDHVTHRGEHRLVAIGSCELCVRSETDAGEACTVVVFNAIQYVVGGFRSPQTISVSSNPGPVVELRRRESRDAERVSVG